MKLFLPGWRTRAQNDTPANGNDIKEKALSLELTDFWTIDGWIDKWKQKHKVTLQAV